MSCDCFIFWSFVDNGFIHISIVSHASEFICLLRMKTVGSCRFVRVCRCISYTSVRFPTRDQCITNRCRHGFGYSCTGLIPKSQVDVARNNICSQGQFLVVGSGRWWFSRLAAIAKSTDQLLSPSSWAHFGFGMSYCWNWIAMNTCSSSKHYRKAQIFI